MHVVVLVMHWPEVLHVRPEAHVPHEPPHPSLPQTRPAHWGVHVLVVHWPALLQLRPEAHVPHEPVPHELGPHTRPAHEHELLVPGAQARCPPEIVTHCPDAHWALEAQRGLQMGAAPFQLTSVCPEGQEGVEGFWQRPRLLHT